MIMCELLHIFGLWFWPECDTWAFIQVLIDAICHKQQTIFLGYIDIMLDLMYHSITLMIKNVLKVPRELQSQLHMAQPYQQPLQMCELPLVFAWPLKSLACHAGKLWQTAESFFWLLILAHFSQAPFWRVDCIPRKSCYGAEKFL